MNRNISLDVVEAYSLCPRKAYLLMQGQDGVSHEYEMMVKEQEEANREAYRKGVAENATGTCAFPELAAGRKVLVGATVQIDGLEAPYDALKRVKEASGLGRFSYEPLMVVGTRQVNKSQVIGLAYLGHVLGQAQNHLPSSGTIIRIGNQPFRVKLTSKYREIETILAALKACREDSAEPPPVVLNRHCPSCPFRDSCRPLAEQEDNLSLLETARCSTELFGPPL